MDSDLRRSETLWRAGQLSQADYLRRLDRALGGKMLPMRIRSQVWTDTHGTSLINYWLWRAFSAYLPRSDWTTIDDPINILLDVSVAGNTRGQPMFWSTREDLQYQDSLLSGWTITACNEVPMNPDIPHPDTFTMRFMPRESPPDLPGSPPDSDRPARAP